MVYLLAEQGISRRWRAWLILTATLSLNQEPSYRGARARPCEPGQKWSAGLPRSSVSTHGIMGGAARLFPMAWWDCRICRIPHTVLSLHNSVSPPMVIVNRHTEVAGLFSSLSFRSLSVWQECDVGAGLFGYLISMTFFCEVIWWWHILH